MSAYQDLDNSIFLFIAQDMRNPFLDFVMPLVSNYIAWIPVLLALLGYFFWEKKDRAILLLLAAVLSVVASELFCSQLLKELVMRVRPCGVFTEVQFLGSCTDSFSFPSSHAANSFAIFAAITYFFHRFWHLASIGAFLVAFSRIYLGVHYASDVLAGAAIGAIIGFGIAAWLDTAYTKFLDKRKKSVW